MSERKIKIRSGGVLNSEAFFEASGDELRVLVAIMQNPLTYSTAEEIAEVARVTKSRAAAAIALFLEEGLIIREGEVTYEFEERIDDGEIIKRDSLEVANTIRKKSLGELFLDLASMMGKESLNNDEIKRLTALTEDLVLSEEYILTLAQHLLSISKSLSVLKLVEKAKKLARMEICTTESLEEYLKIKESESTLEWEFKKLFKKTDGIVSKTEIEYYKKWTQIYGFSSEIILFALDMNVKAKTKYSYSYMDKLLERWHESGCKTLEDCTRQYEADRVKIAEEIRRENVPTAKRTKKTEAPTPKFGDFNPDEALERAIAKSFAKIKTDD